MPDDADTLTHKTDHLEVLWDRWLARLATFLASPALGEDVLTEVLAQFPEATEEAADLRILMEHMSTVVHLHATATAKDLILGSKKRLMTTLTEELAAREERVAAIREAGQHLRMVPPDDKG